MQALDKEHVDRPENPPVEHLLGEITKTYENHKNVHIPSSTHIPGHTMYKLDPDVPRLVFTCSLCIKKVLQSLKLHMGYFLDIKSLNTGSSRICVASAENRPFFDILSL